MIEASQPQARLDTPASAGGHFWLVICWLWVGVPLAWGVWRTLQTLLALFR